MSNANRSQKKKDPSRINLDLKSLSKKVHSTYRRLSESFSKIKTGLEVVEKKLNICKDLAESIKPNEAMSSYDVILLNF